MDFIGMLASKFGVDEDAARAIAGTAVGSVQSAVKRDSGDEAAAEVEAAIPEMSDWKSKAKAVLDRDDDEGGGGLLSDIFGGGTGDILSSVAGAIGGEQAKEMATLIALFGKLGIDAEKAQLAAPFVLDFLKKRLSPELLSLATSATPVLLGGQPSDDSEEAKDEGGGDLVSNIVGSFFK